MVAKFPLFINRGKNQIPLLGDKQWRKLEERRAFVIGRRQNYGTNLATARLMWLNRNIESRSTIFSGTDMQLSSLRQLE